jgi:hypothetical protein
MIGSRSAPFLPSFLCSAADFVVRLPEDVVVESNALGAPLRHQLLLSLLHAGLLSRKNRA